MSTSTQLSDALQRAFQSRIHGVVGLVDSLLKSCPEQGLRLHWQRGHCRVHCAADDSLEVLNCPVPKSVFRAILARVGMLCNQRRANSVSPYGGEGELAVDGDAPAVFRATFTNTTEEQKLELIPVSAHHG